LPLSVRTLLLIIGSKTDGSPLRRGHPTATMPCKQSRHFGDGNVRTSEFRRPLLTAMENGDELQPLVSHTVGDDEWSVRYDKLSCSEHSTWSPHLGVFLEKVNGLENPPGDESCILL
jgi:hypothetical protein